MSESLLVDRGAGLSFYLVIISEACHHAETAWASLTPELQAAVSIQVVRASLSEQTAKFRAEHGATNQVFIARDTDGKEVGYVWVGQVKSAFTGATQAHILNLFVDENYRGQWIGHRLMIKAEEWARQNKLDRIGLSVAAQNAKAVSLYEETGYSIETYRMSKTIDDSGEPLPIENDIEWFNDFKFIAPAVIVDSDLELKLEETCSYNP